MKISSSVYKTGRVPVTRPVLDQINKISEGLLDLAKQRYNVAFTVNCYPIFIFKRVKSTIPCTCRADESIPYWNDKDDDENLVINDTSNKIHIEDIDEQVNTDEFGSFLEDNEDRVDKELSEIEDYTTEDTDTLIEDLLLDDIKNGCGICLDSGFYPGYDLIGGKRIILDGNPYHRFNKYKLHNIVLNRNNRPFNFEITANEASITWERVFIPYSHLLIGYGLFDNKEKFVGGWKIYVKRSDVATWNEINHYSQLINFMFTNTPNNLDFKIEFTKRALSSFTHFVLVLFTNEKPILADMTKLNKALDFTMAEGIQTTTFSIPTDIYPQIEDVIYDTKIGKLWKITSINQFGRKDFGLDLDCRMIQSYEVMGSILNPNIRKFKG